MTLKASRLMIDHTSLRPLSIVKKPTSVWLAAPVPECTWGTLRGNPREAYARPPKELAILKDAVQAENIHNLCTSLLNYKGGEY